jgi:CHASE2 domain-containing sensor protein
VPALHQWQLVLPLALALAVSFALAWRGARQRSTRDILLAFGIAIATSLLINDSAAYELAAGIAVVGGFARFAPAPAPARARVLAPATLEPEPVPSESPPS